jgi:hypothetical protein
MCGSTVQETFTASRRARWMIFGQATEMSGISKTQPVATYGRMRQNGRIVSVAVIVVVGVNCDGRPVMLGMVILVNGYCIA